jgi:tRNA-specific 2-thiouridylase
MKIAMLLSGGVDSSVALSLLKKEGHILEAFYIKIWLEDELSYLGNCPWQEDISYAQKVCKDLNVTLNIIPLQKEYWDLIVSYTLDQIKQGYTPSPDIMCNSQIKFGCFYDTLNKTNKSFDKIATGHYARCDSINGHYVLKKSIDTIKDQTYFLSRLTQEQLSRALFPIGHMTKTQVRAYAKKENLATYNRKDSQGICFLGKIKFHDFIKHHIGVHSGPLIELETQKQVGTHEGFWFYTIGQRKGIGLSGGPWYVVAKEPKSNTVFISKKYFSPEKKRDRFFVNNLFWISGETPEDKILETLNVKVRHGEQSYACKFIKQENKSAQVILDGCDQGLAPGQFAVFYKKDICLGSGVIANEF